jgi:hypothetical protein
MYWLYARFVGNGTDDIAWFNPCAVYLRQCGFPYPRHYRWSGSTFTTRTLFAITITVLKFGFLPRAGLIPFHFLGASGLEQSGLPPTPCEPGGGNLVPPVHPARLFR